METHNCMKVCVVTNVLLSLIYTEYQPLGKVVGGEVDLKSCNFQRLCLYLVESIETYIGAVTMYIARKRNEQI